MLEPIINYIVETVGSLGYIGIFFIDVSRKFVFPFSK